MKKIFFILIAILFTIKLAYAEKYYGITKISSVNLKDVEIFGPAKLEKVKFKKLNIHGTLEFNNLEVDGDALITGPIINGYNGRFGLLKVIGSVKGRLINCNFFTIVGSLDVSDLTVKEDIYIVGTAKIDNSYLKNLEVASDEIILNNVEVKDIVIEKNNPLNHTANKQKQVLYLKGKTIVRGNISFQSRKGVIFIDKNATIIGKVNGAVITNL